MRFLPRIVLSSLLLLGALGACDAPEKNPGIGTSPSADDDPVLQTEPLDQIEAPLAASLDCGLWIGATYELAEARHTAAPANPDMRQYALPGGLSCAALIAAAPAVEASWGGVAVIHYVSLAKPAMLLLPAAAPPAWRAATLHRALPTPKTAAFPILAVLAILAPLIQTVVGKIFTSQVKDSNRRTQILGYADTAFQLVEALGPQLGLTGHEKYVRFVQQIVDNLKAAGQPELTAQELQQLQNLAQVKAMLAKAPAAPARPPLPLPPPPRG